jgi:DNA polymerase-3 subunit alpha
MTKKNNEKMAFIRIADLTGSLECVVFPKTYVEVKNLCAADKLVIVKGTVSDRNGERSMLIDTIKELK